MVIVDQPELAFTYRRNIFSTDALEFIAELETLTPETIVGHLTGKLEATRGVWLRVGRYRISNGSFIDPSDLMLYVEQYYDPEEDGPICALELNHRGSVPDGARTAETVDGLLDALVQLDLEGDPDSGESADNGQLDADGTDAEPQADGEQTGGEPEEAIPPSRFEGMTIVEPAGAFEMHGALTSGWHAMYYEAADGSSLLVFD